MVGCKDWTRPDTHLRRASDSSTIRSKSAIRSKSWGRAGRLSYWRKGHEQGRMAAGVKRGVMTEAGPCALGWHDDLRPGAYLLLQLQQGVVLGLELMLQRLLLLSRLLARPRKLISVLGNDTFQIGPGGNEEERTVEKDPCEPRTGRRRGRAKGAPMRPSHRCCAVISSSLASTAACASRRASRSSSVFDSTARERGDGSLSTEMSQQRRRTPPLCYSSAPQPACPVPRSQPAR